MIISTPNHIIHQANLNLVFNTGDQIQALDIQHKLAAFMKEEIVRELEILFDEVTDSDEIIRIDEVVLELEPLTTNDIQNFPAFVKLKAQQIFSTAISKVKHEGNGANYTSGSDGTGRENKVLNIQRTTVEKSALEQFIYFIRTGQKAWHQSDGNVTEVEYGFTFSDQEIPRHTIELLQKLIEEQPEHLRQALLKHLTEKRVQQRLALQFSLEEQAALFSLFLGKQSNVFHAFLKQLVALEKVHPFLSESSQNKILTQTWKWIASTANKEQLWTKASGKAETQKTLWAWWTTLINSFHLKPDLEQGDISDKKDLKIPSNYFNHKIEKYAFSLLWQSTKDHAPHQNLRNQLLSLLREKGHFTANILEKIEKSTDAKTTRKLLQKLAEEEKIKHETKQAGSQKEKTQKENEVRRGLAIETEEEKYEKHFIHNAGITLCSAFLTFLFEGLGYTKKGEWVDEVKRSEAVLLIHHIAANKEHTKEEQLILPKIMCGLEPYAELAVISHPNEATKTEINAMLEMMIRRWSALGSISPDGLRKNYFRRNGILVKKDDVTWELTVQKNYYDVLLDELPWSVAIFKPPWTDYVLSTVYDKLEEFPSNEQEEIQEEEILEPIETEASDPTENIIQNSFLEEVKKNGIHLYHAGIVILGPFIETLFEGMGYTKEGEFINEKAQYRAFHLLQHISHGATAADESELGLHKLICGFSLTDPVPVESSLSEEEKTEALYLLEMLVIRWDALGKSSPEALVQNYIHREGYLVLKDNTNWELHIERKTIDVLLDRLPWSIGMLKTRWNNFMITVKW